MGATIFSGSAQQDVRVLDSDITKCSPSVCDHFEFPDKKNLFCFLKFVVKCVCVNICDILRIISIFVMPEWSVVVVDLVEMISLSLAVINAV